MAEQEGAAPYLAVPAANAAERQRALHDDGATLEQIYAGLALVPPRELVGG